MHFADKKMSRDATVWGGGAIVLSETHDDHHQRQFDLTKLLHQIPADQAR